MLFKIVNDQGEVDLVFSWRERVTLFLFGKIHFTSYAFKKFGNVLVDIVMGWNTKHCPDHLKKFINSPSEGKLNLKDDGKGAIDGNNKNTS